MSEDDKTSPENPSEKKFKVVDKRIYATDDRLNPAEGGHENSKHGNAGNDKAGGVEDVEKDGYFKEARGSDFNSNNIDNINKNKTPPENEELYGDAIKADFATFIYSLNAQALVYLGKLTNPVTGKYEKDIKTARYLIDTIEMLALKTKGNLDENESKLVDNILYDLRMFFISAK